MKLLKITEVLVANAPLEGVKMYFIDVIGCLAIFVGGIYAGAILERLQWKLWLKKNYRSIYEENGGDRAY